MSNLSPRIAAVGIYAAVFFSALALVAMRDDGDTATPMASMAAMDAGADATEAASGVRSDIAPPGASAF